MLRSKTCFKCNITKPLDDFYAHPMMADGRLGKCKECAKADVSKHRLDNIDRIRAYDRTRGKISERAKKAAAVSAEWRKADKRRGHCHNAVARALRSGKLAHKNCEWEGCDREDSYAHHESYDRPLDVIFYCQPHHKARHKQMKLEGIEP